MADVGEELGFEFIELCKFFALTGDLTLVGLLLGNVAALGGDEDDLALVIHDGHEGGIDDDGFFATGASVDLGVPANEFTLGGSTNGVAKAGVDFLRDLPPKGGPEGFAFDIGELNSYGIERDLVDLEDCTLGVEKTDELNHESKVMRASFWRYCSRVSLDRS